MAVARVDIEVNSKGDVVIKKVVDGLGDVEKKSKTAKSALDSIFQGVGQGFGQSLYAGLMKVAGGIAQLSSRGSEILGVKNAFEQLTAAAGQSADGMLSSMRNASQGLISDYDLMANANKAMLLGLPVTEKEMGILSKTAIVLGQAMRLGPTKAMEDLITGLGRGSPMILDNLGITVNAEEAYQRYAAGIGKSAQALTEQEKKLAIYNAAMTAAMDAVDRIGGIQLNAAEAATVLATRFKNLYDEVAVLIAESPALGALLQGIGVILGQLTGEVKGNQSALRELIEGGVLLVAKGLVFLMDVVQGAIDVWDSLKLTWISLKAAAAALSIALSELLRMWALVAGDKAAAQHFAENTERLKAAKLAAEKETQALLDGNTKKTNSIQNYRAQLVQLQKTIETATAAERRLGGVKPPPPPGGADPKALEKAKAEAEKMRQFWFQFYISNLQDHGKWLDEQERQANAKVQRDVKRFLEEMDRIQELRDARSKLAAQEAEDELATSAAEREGIARDTAEQVQSVRDLAAGMLDLNEALGGATDSWLAMGAGGLTVLANLHDETLQEASAITKLAGALSAAGAIFSQGRRNLSGRNAAVSGAMTGAAAGAAFGPWGAAIGGLAGGLLGFFSGSKFRGIARDAGRVLGVELGQEAVEAIEATMNDLNVSAGVAALLHLDAAIADSGRSASSFAPQFAQLMAGIAKGTIPAKEGLAQLDTVFSQMRTELEAAGGAGFRFLESMVEMAQATGTMTAAMKDFIKETGKAAGPGFKALFDNVLKQVDSTVGALGGRVNRLREELKDPSLSDDDQDRIKNRIHALEGQADDAAARAGARLNDLGILAMAAVQRMREAGASSAEIFEALGPAIDSAIEAAQKAGVELTGPFAELASQRAFQQLNQDLVAAAEGLEFVARAAGRSPEAIAALSNETNRLYQEMKAAAIEMGHTEEGASGLALTPLVPTLAHLNQLAKEGKIVLDEETLALIAQAEAAGLLDPTEQEKMLEIANLQLLAISALVTAFGAQLPAAVQAYIDSLNSIPNVPGPPGAPGPNGNNNGGGGPPGDDPPGLASGDILMPKAGGHVRRLAEAGQAELAAPVKAFSARLAEDLARVVGGHQGAVAMGDVLLEIDRRAVAEAHMAGMRRNTGGARNQQERIARGRRP